jgi:hypothetical protein
LNTAYASDLGENLRQYNRLRLFRKHLYRLGHVCVGAEPGFQVEEAAGWITLANVPQASVRHIDHEPRQVRCIRDGGVGDVHEVFQAPVLCGVTDVALNLEAQAVVVLELVVGEFQVAAEEDDRGPGVRMQVGLDDDDDMQRVRERFVEQWGLVEAGLDGAFDGGGFERHSRDVAVIQLAAIRATWATPGRRACVGPI